MVTVHLMVGVMSQVELALVMKDMMETSVKVNTFFTWQYVFVLKVNWQIHTDDCYYNGHYYGCPGEPYKCLDQGWCNYCTGTCNCYEGYQGYACEGKDFLHLTNER